MVTGRPAVSAVTVWRREGGGGSAVGRKASREEWPLLRPEQSSCEEALGLGPHGPSSKTGAYTAKPAHVYGPAGTGTWPQGPHGAHRNTFRPKEKVNSVF